MQVARLGIRLPHELRQQIEAAARARRLDLSDWCREVLTEAAKRDMGIDDSPMRDTGASRQSAPPGRLVANRKRPGS